MKCGYEWNPPMLTPPSSTNGSERAVSETKQVCVLEKGHEKWHRSASNLITPNKKEN